MKQTVFIQSNEKQYFGALLARYSLLKNSSNPSAFNVEIMRLKDHPALFEKEGKAYLKKGQKVIWKNNDLQSFTPLRFLPPTLMDFSGRALVIDPDVFALGDVLELFKKNMNEKSIMCHYSENEKGRKYRTSVMLLDCHKLGHWKWESDIEDLFTFKKDYRIWMCLQYENGKDVGFLKEHWNHYDKLDQNTKLIHYTKRLTQPWKTGLPVDFVYDPLPPVWKVVPGHWVLKAKALVFPKRYKERMAKRYLINPFPEQAHFFFGLVREALKEGHVSKSFIEEQIHQGHVRPDLFECLRNT